MSTFLDSAVEVRVPATSANLGPGFDSLGLALGLYDELRAEVTGGGLDIEIDADADASQIPRDESHLVVRAMRATFTGLGDQPNGLALHCTNRIPHARGLGSSAAAIVAGILLARGLVADGTARMSDSDVLTLAATIEGHPDNVAPCLLGGLTIAWQHSDFRTGQSARAVRRDPDRTVMPLALIPPFTASTEHARGLLPEVVPHADAAFSAARAALLVAALTGASQALFDATEDRLHQGYREPAMPESLALVAQLRRAGHPAVISGAGPTVLILSRGDAEAERVLAMAPDGWTALALPIDVAGATVGSAGN